MEDILQVILEVVLQFVFELLADLAGRALSDHWKVILKVLFYGIVGWCCGWVSSLLFPEAFIHNEGLRIAYLVCAPVLLGFLMSRIGRVMSMRGKRRSTLESFGYGWLFALAFALGRYVATK